MGIISYCPTVIKVSQGTYHENGFFTLDVKNEKVELELKHIEGAAKINTRGEGHC